MKQILRLSQVLGLKTLGATAELFIRSWGMPQPFKYFVRLAAHDLNSVNTTQMIVDKFLRKYVRKFVR
jgi:hypothetical protein